jgi:hypothetical protein
VHEKESGSVSPNSKKESMPQGKLAHKSSDDIPAAGKVGIEKDLNEDMHEVRLDEDRHKGEEYDQYNA